MKRLACVTLLIAPFLATSAAAGGLHFKAKLTGAEEVPPVVTRTSGKATFKVNRRQTRINFKLTIKRADRVFAGPGGHLHCGPFGENGPVIAFLAGGVPTGLSGKVEIKATLDDGNIIPTDCGSTVAEIVDAIHQGNVYVNIHSAANPAGVIRGQVYGTRRNDGDSDSDSDSDD